MARPKKSEGKRKAEEFKEKVLKHLDKDMMFCMGCHANINVEREAIALVVFREHKKTGFRAYACPYCGTIKMIPGFYVNLEAPSGS